MDINAQIRRMSENSLVRKALVEFLAEWEMTVSGSSDSLRYGPLAEKADALIEAVTALAVQRVREDMREPSKVVAPPLVMHFLTRELLDACGQAPRGARVVFTPVVRDVTCPECREIVRCARTIDLAEMTMRLGLDQHEQTAVQAFSGEGYGHMWTEAEAEELITAWDAERNG